MSHARSVVLLVAVWTASMFQRRTWSFLGSTWQSSTIRGKTPGSAPTLRRDRNERIDDDTTVGANPFDILGLNREDELSEADVKAAYKSLVKVYHPDVPKTGSADKFRIILKALKRLSTKEGRKLWKGKKAADGSVEYGGAVKFWKNTERKRISVPEWVRRRKKIRLARKRLKLTRSKVVKKLVTSDTVSRKSLDKIRDVFLKHLEVALKTKTVTAQSNLIELGFRPDIYNNIAKEDATTGLILIDLEEAFNIELADIIQEGPEVSPQEMLEGGIVRFGAPKVFTVADLAAYCENLDMEQ